jgi:hypothetical protein
MRKFTQGYEYLSRLFYRMISESLERSRVLPRQVININKDSAKIGTHTGHRAAFSGAKRTVEDEPAARQDSRESKKSSFPVRPICRNVFAGVGATLLSSFLLVDGLFEVGDDRRLIGLGQNHSEYGSLP